MATYDLEEQEQLAEIKTWWKQHGNLLLNVLTAAALVVIAWQGWNWYQRNQTAQASLVFNVLQKAVVDNDSPRIKAASGELVEKYGRTGYASLGALTTAKSMLDAGDAKTAKLQLQWVVEHGKDDFGVGAVAYQQLAGRFRVVEGGFDIDCARLLLHRRDIRRNALDLAGERLLG